MVYLPISWTDADDLRNSPAEVWRVWEGGTFVEGTEDSNLWELNDWQGNNRWKIFLVPSLITVRLDFLGSGEDIIDGNIEEVGRVSSYIKDNQLQTKTLTSREPKCLRPLVLVQVWLYELSIPCRGTGFLSLHPLQTQIYRLYIDACSCRAHVLLGISHKSTPPCSVSDLRYLSFTELNEAISEVSRALIDLGITKNDTLSHSCMVCSHFKLLPLLSLFEPNSVGIFTNASQICHLRWWSESNYSWQHTFKFTSCHASFQPHANLMLLIQWYPHWPSLHLRRELVYQPPSPRTGMYVRTWNIIQVILLCI